MTSSQTDDEVAQETQPEQEGPSQSSEATVDLTDTDANPKEASTTETQTTTEQQQPQPAQRYHWDGILPRPTGFVSKLLSQVSHVEQQKQAEFLTEHLREDQPDLYMLQNIPFNIPVIAHMPGNSRAIRVLHGMGHGHGYGGLEITDIENCALFLQGEYIKGVSRPQSLALQETEVSIPSEYNIPTDAEYRKEASQTLAKFKPHFFTWSRLKTSFNSIKVHPIPTYLVYDGFDKDLDIFVLHERIEHEMATNPDNKCPNTFLLALDFLKAGLVSPTMKMDITLPLDALFRHPCAVRDRWVSNRLRTLYETDGYLQVTPPKAKKKPVPPRTTTPPPAQAPSQATPPSTNPRVPAATPATAGSPDSTTTPPAASARIPTPPPSLRTFDPADIRQVLDSSIASSSKTVEMTESSLLQMLKIFHGGNARKDASSSKEDKDLKKTLGMPQSGYDALLVMCGLAKSMESAIPKMWRELGETGAKKSDMNKAIRKALNHNTFYKCSKVPCIEAITKMIRDRDFEGDVGLSSLTSAVKGLSPFLVPYLTEAQIDDHNSLMEGFNLASSTTPKDFMGTKLKCTCPSTYTGMCKQLKRYANLLHAVFGEFCPLFEAMQTLIEEFDRYNDTSESRVSKETIASVLWIIMLQSRHFAAGQMTGDTPFLPVFNQLLLDVNMERPIKHGQVPSSLFEVHSVLGKNKNPPTGTQNIFIPDPKKGRFDPNSNGMVIVERPEIYHPAMKSAMAKFKALKPRPTVLKLCKACGTQSNRLFPNSPDVCVRGQLWGACERTCKYAHRTLPDTEIAEAIRQLQKVIDNPSLLPKV